MGITFIGSTVSIVAGTVATETATAYATATSAAEEIGRIISWGETKDKSSDETYTLMKTGRVTHVSGERDVGPVAFTINYDTDDGGYAILKSNSNTNTNLILLIEDPDGDVYYMQGIAADVGIDGERGAKAIKNVSGTFRVNSAITDVPA